MKLKKQKAKKVCHKKTLKFQNYKNCLEAIQPESKINHVEKNEIDVGSPKKGYKNSWKQ